MADSIPNGVPKTNGVSKTVVNGYKGSHAAKHNLAAHFIGGNHLEVAAPGRVKDFVAESDGHTVITSVRLPASGNSEGPWTWLTMHNRF